MSTSRTSTSNSSEFKYPGIPLTTNGNQLVSYYTEARLADAGIFYPITPSTEMGENFQLSFANGELNVFGNAKVAIETEGEHAAQGGAIAFSTTGKRVVNFTSGQGILYGVEQYYHAPAKFSTMVLEVAARALTKTALNVHCGHDDVYAALDTGWIILFGKDAQQAADQALILRKVTELTLNPGINVQDGFLTSHLERTFKKAESALIREYLGRADDVIECPTEAQKALFGPTRLRVPAMYDLRRPMVLGTVQNQEHYMNGIVARRNNFVEPILGFLETAYEEFAALTGRRYGIISEYNTKNADTVFVALGSAAENVEAAVDYIKQQSGEQVGIIHANVIRPFPAEVIVNALKGRKNVIVLERMDDPTAGDGPLTRDIRNALYKGLENSRTNAHRNYPTVTQEEMPRVYSGVYGLGSRDFRPEHILGAYEYVTKGRSRQDKATSEKGEHFFYLGVDHPYAVCSDDTPSLLPEGSIAVRMHSIGGWGMITTGKNLSEVLGTLGSYVVNRDYPGQDKEILHLSANPKYGSEKKGAPTNYFLVAAPERIRMNCDLQHVNVVLCCDSKAFTHTNPVLGLHEGGALIIESNEDSPEAAWERIPVRARKEIVEKNIRVFTLPGFDIARKATPRPDLQLRMQGNAFLGAFFAVSSFLDDYKIPRDEFLSVVESQYQKKFGKFGKAVIESNMTVMKEGFSRVQELPYGNMDAPDRSDFRGTMIAPILESELGCNSCSADLPPVFTKEMFDSEFRAGLGYHQPASVLAASGAIAPATGAESSKFGARLLVPKWIPENCTQCMSCITACPDTALPNTAQELGSVLKTFVNSYVSDASARSALLAVVPEWESKCRAIMADEAKKKTDSTPFADVAKQTLAEVLESSSAKLNGSSEQTAAELNSIIEKIPVAYAKVAGIFGGKEKKSPGSGGIFSIFVSDLCKGCAQCVVECGDHNALVMVEEDEDINADLFTGTNFFKQLPETPGQYLGIYDPEDPNSSKAAALQNHLMRRYNYEAFVAGDGACAGCGEKTVLRSLGTLTEAYMRPLYHRKADRLREKVSALKESGTAKLSNLEKEQPERYEIFKRTVLHTLLNCGGETAEESKQMVAEANLEGNEQLIDAICAVMETEAVNHGELIAIEGRALGGMSVMGMTAHTGCSTVYGSTPPANPHPYPWMNSLFQDGVTIGWLIGESFIQSHARRSVVPERLADSVVSNFDEQVCALSESDYFTLTHMTDTEMTDQEVRELPKIWALGGDGGMGDIGFQNLSKTVLQNRPNVQVLMLDTQVYSNTGGQNSDSSPMPGGFDMNQFGEGSHGKLTEKKEVAQIMTVGHGSPFIAQVSAANTPNMYKAMLEGLDYRGSAFFQCYTTCQPEHGVGDSESTQQAQKARDSRGVIEFVANPTLGETFKEVVSLKGNPSLTRDWYQKTIKKTKTSYQYTVAHWATTEARFRRHLKKAPADVEQTAIHLDDMLLRITQQDAVNRRFLDKEHRAYIPEFGVYAMVEQADGTLKPALLSRQMVLFCVERRKNWRMIQDRAGLANEDYPAQKELLKRYDAGEISKDEFFGPLQERFAAIKAELAK